LRVEGNTTLQSWGLPALVEVNGDPALYGFTVSDNVQFEDCEIWNQIAATQFNRHFGAVGIQVPILVEQNDDVCTNPTSCTNGYIESVTDLEALVGCQNLAGGAGTDLTITTTFISSDLYSAGLAGLNALETIGEDLIIQNTSLENLADLDRLRTIGGSIYISDNNLLSKMHVPSLEHISNSPVYLFSGNPELPDCQVRGLFTRLNQFNPDWNFINMSGNNNDVCPDPIVCAASNNTVFNQNYTSTDIATELGNCNLIEGTVIIDNLPATAWDSLGGLFRINGDLLIQNQVTSAGTGEVLMASLKAVGGELKFYRNNLVDQFDPFVGVLDSAQDLTLDGNFNNGTIFYFGIDIDDLPGTLIVRANNGFAGFYLPGASTSVLVENNANMNGLSFNSFPSTMSGYLRIEKNPLYSECDALSWLDQTVAAGQENTCENLSSAECPEGMSGMCDAAE